MGPPTTIPSGNHQHHQRQGLAALSLGAIGVVYGDIGTSPLYTMSAVFSPATGILLNTHNLMGAVSTIFWALMLVITIKYVMLILRADNNGEGGVLTLTALASVALRDRPQLRKSLLLLGISGSALFYGDCIITPAITVLGAMEGLEVITPAFKSYIVPISVTVLVGLFLIQRFGSGLVGKFFGPVMVLWFVVLGVIGAINITGQPSILAALNPLYAWQFVSERGWHLLATLGAIVLALTGAEALYADMGHFGRKPIQLAWMGLALPCLTLNYMGQGALLIADKTAIQNPFFRLFPSSIMVFVVVLATLAAIIASQSVISGTYSMTRQAIQLGFLPRMTIHHTSVKEIGQIYMPLVNWVLLAGVLAAVAVFQTSAALAAAYGVAVTLTMMITTILTYFVIHNSWKLSRPLAISATLFFLVFDVLLVSGCVIKFFEGGWFPLVIGLIIFTGMTTWSRGRALLMESIRREGIELESFITTLDPRSVVHVERTAIYPVADPVTVPQALLHNLKHNQVLHVRNVILTVRFHEVPWIPMDKRIHVESLGRKFWRITVHYGFMNTPDIPKALTQAESQGLPVAEFETSYFLSRETVVPATGSGMVMWRERLFAVMSRNASGVVEFFRLPDNAVVELGTRVQI